MGCELTKLSFGRMSTGVKTSRINWSFFLLQNGLKLPLSINHTTLINNNNRHANHHHHSTPHIAIDQQHNGSKYGLSIFLLHVKRKDSQTPYIPINNFYDILVLYSIANSKTHDFTKNEDFGASQISAECDPEQRVCGKTCCDPGQLCLHVPLVGLAICLLS
ncbi:hypothetical protein Bhyg_15271, partial [Pseudolycoriella hygida]